MSGTSAEDHVRWRPSTCQTSTRSAPDGTRLKRHSLWHAFMLRVALVFMLGLLTAVSLLVAAGFNNGLVWLLMLSLVAGQILVCSAAAGRLDTLRASRRKDRTLPLRGGR